METLPLKLKFEDTTLNYKNLHLILYSICNIKTDIQILKSFATCKEDLLRSISDVYIENRNKIDLKLIISTSISFDDKMEQIVKTINMFSSINKWSKVIVYKTTQKNLYIFDLPKQWFKYPQLISIITFIIAAYINYKIAGIDTIKDFIEEVKKLHRGDEDHSSIFYTTNWMDYIPLVMEFYDHLFKNEDPQYLYDCGKCADGDTYKYITRSGIKSLCLCRSLSNNLNKKLKYLKGGR